MIDGRLYVFNDREGTDETAIKSKKYGIKYESGSILNAHYSGTGATASGKQFQYLPTLHAKLFLLI